MLLVRKINQDRWDSVDQFLPMEVPAERLRTEFNAKGNRLSLWQVSNEDNINDAMLAIASGLDQLETFDVAWFPVGQLTDECIELESTKGDTRVLDLAENHVNAVKLDSFRLAKVARAVARAIVESRVRRIVIQELTQLLATAVEDDRLGISTLPIAIRKKVESALEQRRKDRETGAEPEE